jgi:ankyrin repeat protein
MASVATMTKPYRELLKGDWQAMRRYFMEHNEHLYAPMTVSMDTALHIAVYSGNVKLLKKLLSVEAMEMDVKMLHELKNDSGNTPLHVAAAAGNIEMALLLIEKDKELLETPNNNGQTPLFTAAAYGWIDMVEFLDPRVKDKKKHRKTGEESILHVAVIGKHFGRLCLSFISST